MKKILQLFLLMAISAGCDYIMPRFAEPKSRFAKLQIMELEGAIQLFSHDSARYPTTAEGLDALVHKPNDLGRWNGPYLAKSVPIDPWGRAYLYKCPGDNGLYDLYSYGRDGVVGGNNEDADIVNWKNSSN
jgi:general secretion pathway protein G